MAPSLWDGTLSIDDFNASAKALMTKWREIDVEDSLPDWTWKPCCTMGVASQVEGFLALEGVFHTGAGSQTEDNNNLSDEGTVEHDTWVQSSSDSVHVYDFHIAYSFSYKVPLLYFQGHQAGGQLLTIDEIKKDLPAHSLNVLSESKWTFITREEHPHLSRPWFTLHPCGTSDWMKLLLGKSGEKDLCLQYLSTWLSVVGQAVGLKIPLKLHCNS
ncbi:ubiquitin-like-conjugating enzyme ATG10 isoform X1 [Brachypodium distachyon]|uniref:Ubiquitin-like-conjugating enzyme ATG10 n=1 Tax=Brachypodium distachyon TaxID=15368 RepID=I1H8U5_BRADI|nr:ubiquitin-like-conjugating enzyme ATG10 isoform X1 [Brachypodium distachyon]XP_010229063.1 ubiquitin-like-conjugating enzyme ATG10 isoform X1 [Brachypodium distachyon]XP_010229065.1 ubiquitin-like-conjugating enzyme ATG10 isoform X1 [Brachypodium distachyon]XP_010229066.1 ubiquitin-like-conjugating enzyme ATG10 isoform X1 [Brachypodium distachyon]XP_014752599.1 ubiquitin-like-conjugating enzyme ATG10 isoform X1 [Brachypodium distachyon]XP_014752600.1 ubiquitin-like-conjugating enzyme ATG10 |eukprot:XP_003558639.1 ubiquitin-like-conjugating enzyme ATG10 isoform X1 [Brachypodium distachyon]